MTNELSAPEVFTIAHDLMREHLDESWSFRLDHAKRRAGSCNYRKKEITVSKHFIAQASAQELQQVLLHEVAHALAGHESGHGPAWQRTARALGYTGQRTLDKDFAADLATWVGTCPEGHTYRRFRRPPRQASCTHCAPRFDARFIIEWRSIDPQARS